VVQVKPGRFARVRHDNSWDLVLYDAEDRVRLVVSGSTSEEAEEMIDLLMATLLSQTIENYLGVMRTPLHEVDQREMVRERRYLVGPDRQTRDAWANRRDLRRHQYTVVHTPDNLRGPLNPRIVFLGWPKTWDADDIRACQENVHIATRGNATPWVEQTHDLDFWKEPSEVFTL
jgi:hypothetical protein